MKKLYVLALLVLVTACDKAESKTPASAAASEAAKVVEPATPPAPVPPPVVVAVDAAPEPATAWVVLKEVDPMTDLTDVGAISPSLEPVEEMFGTKSHASLIVRCSEKSLDVFIAVPNMVDSDFSDMTSGRYRFGTSAATNIQWSVATDRKGVFFKKPAGWISLFQKHENEVFTVEVPIFNEPSMVAKFSLAGASRDLPQVLAACKE